MRSLAIGGRGDRCSGGLLGFGAVAADLVTVDLLSTVCGVTINLHKPCKFIK